MGTIEQPDSIEKGVEFWDGHEKVVIHEGGGSLDVDAKWRKAFSSLDGNFLTDL